MNPLPPCLRLAAGLAVCLASGAGFALSLGAAEGPVTLGRPLEVEVQVELDEGQPQPPCVQADVFYGSQRVNPGRVSAQVGSGRTVRVRVRSTAAVDDPVVTMTLQVGCGVQVARRYVLLAAQAPREPGRDAALLAAAEPGSIALATAAPAAVVPPSVASAADLPAATTLPRRTVSRAPVSAAMSQPVLRLGDASPPAEPEPVLRLTGMLAMPAGSLEQRAAAAALWRALSAAPEDALRDAQRLQALQAEAQALREGMRSRDAQGALLRNQAQITLPQRYADPWLYLVAALALVVGAAAALLWRRMGHPALNRWSRAGRDPDTEFGPTSLPPLRPGSPSAPPRQRSASSEMGASQILAAVSGGKSNEPVVPQLGDEYHGSQPASLRSVTVEEVHDPNTSFFHSVQGEGNGFDPGLDINLDFDGPGAPTTQLKPAGKS